uniref:Membrane metallo-endopeptidase-like 1 n=1 Tax=Bactrocera dorsalis TaxID=27457 RepID=A0A034WGX2_BACDO
MSSPCHGLLALLIITLIVDWPWPWPERVAQAMSIPTERPGHTQSKLNSTGSALFRLPTQIDEYAVLEEFGRLTLATMNQSVDPCEDFYEYACGNWKQTEMVPARSRNNTFLNGMQFAVNEMLTQFLKNATEKEMKLDNAESKAKAFFASCMRMSEDMSEGYKLLLEMDEFAFNLNEKRESNETFDWININFLSLWRVSFASS